MCQCDCGNIVTVKALNLYSGNTKSCGCLAKELAHQKSINNVIGKRFGKLVPLREADDSKPKATKMLCKCDCGNEKSIRIDDLLSGVTKSCGCLKRENAEDLTGKVFNELTAIKQVENHIGRNGLERVQWLFRCSCGREIIAMPMNVKRGKTKSCGHIGNSYAEHKMFKFLTDHNIPFEYNSCPYNDLINPSTGRSLFIDFIITRPDGEKIIIEHQGEQHFYSGKKANAEFGKLQREVTDQIKREYFIKNNIQFYETKHNEDYMLHLKNILTENGFDINIEGVN